MAPIRIACLFVPLFPLAARLRSEPELSGEALAIFEGNGGAARVAAASRPARRAGIRPGLSAVQARALVPGLLVRGRDAECERSAREALIEAAESFSPRVEEEEPGIVSLDASGLGRHFPGEAPERSLGQSLIAAAEGVGLPARAGVAGSKLAARVAAERPRSPTVVAPGSEAAFLAGLPLSRLAPPVDLAESLARWGLSTIGEFARLPEAAVESRLGERGGRLHRMARAVDPRPLVPREAPPDFQEGMDLEWPLVAVEPFLFIARAALERLSGRLAARALACRRLTLSLALDPEGSDDRSIELPAPTRDVRTLLTLVRLDLEKRPPGAAVAAFRLIAAPDRPRRAQLSLFGPPALSPEDLATAVARLAARVTPERVGRPVAPDGHRPERFSMGPYEPPAAPEIPAAPRAGRGLLALRVLRPAVAIEVFREGARPVRVEPAPGEAAPAAEIRGGVRVASGPWRVEEGWWQAPAAQRDYWDVELSDGGLYRIFREEGSGEWFADGIYD